MPAVSVKTAAGEDLPFGILELEAELSEAAGLFTLVDNSLRQLWTGDLKQLTPGGMALFEHDREEIEGIQFGVSDLGMRLRDLKARFYKLTEAEARHG
jgi:hypothetical protein